MKQFIYRINGQDYIVAVNKLENSIAQVAVNGSNYEVELVNNEEEVTFTANPVAKPTAAAAPKKTVVASTPNKPAGGGSSAGAIKSPLPGIVVGINVNVGDAVKKGQTVAVLEAMKMENSINAPKDGTVTSIGVNPGDSVLEGVTILTIE
ncbi:biotin/lipoyl-containing protein [Dysgonomonas macrotermitis]|uniref:Biotin-requiring enzyme n=1 Tax=Dysgonomonas macrotermitis TaxID=1346286 RepID=A0A1M5IMV3_9BACT|nr:biotin/lipoyl-containing protein [Dysgonomonas macrotermitis]SHG29576.1 Biotin-requiring enzyme [Dysgonomonas macrotermitis]